MLHVQGANGAGKTSLLRMLCGLLLPTEGQVLWRGQSVSALREEFGRELVYIGHGAGLKEDLSPLENLTAACQLGGLSVSPQQTLAALAAAGLGGFEHTPARRLSQGQRRRAALARLALADSAPLWVLDEPFNALDTSACGWLEALLHTHLQRAGLVVLTGHQNALLRHAPQQVLTL
jgi:heme exporter protein A